MKVSSTFAPLIENMIEAVGKRAVTTESFKKGQHYSILPAYTVDGYITWEVYKGGVNTDMFNDFIQNKVLSECEQFSEPHSVLCMNNCRIHHSEVGFHTDISILANSVDKQKLKTMCHDAGVILAYLSPYSLNYNSIEEFFNELKT